MAIPDLGMYKLVETTRPNIAFFESIFLLWWLMIKFLVEHRKLALIVIALCTIAIDYITGKEISFPILDAIVVGACARLFPLFFSIALAVLLGAAGFLLHLPEAPVSSLSITTLNDAIDGLMLVFVAYSMHRLTKAQEEVRILRGFLPICSNCKQIRGKDDNWYQLEEYISKNSEALFSHGICPKCYQVYKQEIEKIAAEIKPSSG